MAQYIDKDALIAQANIEITNYRLAEQEGILTEFGKGKLEGLEGIVDFLNTLEVKEADLEKEVDDYINEHFSECGDGVLISDANSTELTLLDVTSIAKHFFELGLTITNNSNKK